MRDLLIKPRTPDAEGRVHAITPQGAGWPYVGFDLYRLAPGTKVARDTQDREALLVLVQGKARILAGGEDFGEIGERMSVFEQSRPWSVYVPNDSRWQATATTELVLAVCTAPGHGNHPVRLIEPGAVDRVVRSKGANMRIIHPILMEDREWAGSLLITEVFTPQGNWSSYQPHKHDTDAFPTETYLEETYYHRLDPPQGFGFQRVWTDDGSLDHTMAVADGDVVLVPRGYHPCGAPYGYEMYYLNVMAGPIRKWRFRNHSDHDWIARRDAAA